MPVALAGSLMYAITGQLHTGGVASGLLGYIYLPAFGFLTVGWLIGVRLLSAIAGKISDKLHARIYVAILMLVLLAFGIN